MDPGTPRLREGMAEATEVGRVALVEVSGPPGSAADRIKRLTSHSGRTSADRTTGVATGRGSHADTVHAVHAGSACLANLDNPYRSAFGGVRG